VLGRWVWDVARVRRCPEARMALRMAAARVRMAVVARTSKDQRTCGCQLPLAYLSVLLIKDNRGTLYLHICLDARYHA